MQSKLTFNFNIQAGALKKAVDDMTNAMNDLTPPSGVVFKLVVTLPATELYRVKDAVILVNRERCFEFAYTVFGITLGASIAAQFARELVAGGMKLHYRFMGDVPSADAVDLRIKELQEGISYEYWHAEMERRINEEYARTFSKMSWQNDLMVRMLSNDLVFVGTRKGTFGSNHSGLQNIPKTADMGHMRREAIDMLKANGILNIPTDEN